MPEQSLEETVRKELEQITGALENVIGRRSRWSGVVNIEEFVNFSGAKRYDCSISILDKVAEYPLLRRRTLVHEAIHAFSPRYTRTEYDTLIGWEEAVVEQLQRLLRLEVFTRTGIVVDEAELLIGDRQHVYNRYIAVMEDLRDRLGLPAREFYLQLLEVELSARSAFLRQLGGGLESGQAAEAFRVALLLAHAKLTKRS